jgi:hypothetical protein
MTALLHAELLNLRTPRTFAAVVGTAAALSLSLVALGASDALRRRHPRRGLLVREQRSDTACSAAAPVSARGLGDKVRLGLRS